MPIIKKNEAYDLDGMSARLFLILPAIILAACSSVSPAGPAPTTLIAPRDCFEFEGQYSYSGAIASDAAKLQHGSSGAGDFFTGCNDDAQCAFPTLIGAPDAFSLRCRKEGLLIEFNEANRRLGTMTLPVVISAAARNGSGGDAPKSSSLIVEFVTRLGDQPGSWGYGKRRVTLFLYKDPEGALVGLREFSEEGVFWFGVPFWSTGGSWYIFNKTK